MTGPQAALGSKPLVREHGRLVFMAMRTRTQYAEEWPKSGECVSNDSANLAGQINNAGPHAGVKMNVVILGHLGVFNGKHAKGLFALAAICISRVQHALQAGSPGPFQHGTDTDETKENLCSKPQS